MKIHGAARLGVALASIALLATACSSSTKSTSTKTAAGAGGTGSTATGAPIVIGNIGSYTGTQGASVASGRDGIQAWAASVNASGGINGHPVKLIVKDDAQNPTTALADVKQLVSSDHVVAIVSDQSSTDAQWASVVSTAGVPVIGGFGINFPFITNTDFFATGANVLALSYGVQVNAKAIGPKYSMLYCAESPQCAIAVKLEKAIGQLVGVEVPLVTPVSANAADYTALCQAVRDAGVESYTIASSPDVTARVAKACAQQGVTAKQVVAGAVNSGYLTVAALDGTVSVTSSFPAFDNSIPGTQDFQAAMTKFAGGIKDNNGANASEAWVAGKMFEAAVKAIPSGTAITSAAIKSGLYSLKDETLGGIAPPITYTPGKPLFINCWYTTQISNGKVVAPKGLKTECAPDTAIASLFKTVAG